MRLTVSSSKTTASSAFDSLEPESAETFKACRRSLHAVQTVITSIDSRRVKPVVDCIVDSTLPVSINGQRVFLASNLHNNEELLSPLTSCSSSSSLSAFQQAPAMCLSMRAAAKTRQVCELKALGARRQS